MNNRYIVLLYLCAETLRACFYYLHSHWLCSMKGSSTSSCFMKEVLISCKRIRIFFFLTANILSLFSTLILLTLKLCVYLHGDCVCEQGNTLHGLVSTAATTSPHRHTGWDKEVVCLPRQLPPNLHQSVPWLAAAPRVHLQPPPH